MQQLSKTQQEFLSVAINNMISHGVYIKFSNKNIIISDGVRCSGYYGDNKFMVATGLPLEEWFEVFVHEYCHFLQEKENAKVWTNATVKGEDSLSSILEWIKDDNDLSDKVIKDRIKRAQAVEIDCEKRTYKFLKQFNLCSKDRLDTYIQRANSYLLFYPTLFTHKKWVKSSPYKNEAVWSKAPKTFRTKYSYPSQELLEVYEKYML